MAIMNEAQLRRIIREEIKKTKSSIKFISPVAIKKWITQLVKQTKTNPPHDGLKGYNILYKLMQTICQYF